MRVRIQSVAVFVIFVASVLTLLPLSADAQTPPAGAEVRLGARANADGTISVGIQHRESGRWRGTTPRLSVLPADASFGSWYASSSVFVPTRRIEAKIRTERTEWTWEDSVGAIIVEADGKEWRAECGDLRINADETGLTFEAPIGDCDSWGPFAQDIVNAAGGQVDQLVRVVARRLSGSEVELGLQRFVNGIKQSMDQPGTPAVILATRNRWQFTEPFHVPLAAPYVSGELTPGVNIDTVTGRIQVTVNNQTRLSRCGLLELDSLTVTMAIRTATEDCLARDTIYTICGAGAEWECDIQQFQVYAWEGRHDGSAHGIRLTEEQAERVVAAVYTDFVPNRDPPSLRTSERTSYWSDSDHSVFLFAEYSVDGYPLDTVLHETAHAIVDGLEMDDPGHGAKYAATILQVWWRYAPLVDVRAAREDAVNNGIQITDQLPQARSDEGIEEVRRVICSVGEAAQAMCDAHARRTVELSDFDVNGRFVGRGSLSNGWYGADVDEENGGLDSWLILESEELREDLSIARLQFRCEDGKELKARVWWRRELSVATTLSYRFDRGRWLDERWRTPRGWIWGVDEWGVHDATDALSFAQTVFWMASSSDTLVVRFEQDGQEHSASFRIKDISATPLQRNLVQCGAFTATNVAKDPTSFVGRGYLVSGWYGAEVDEESEGLDSWLIMESEERQADLAIARLQFRCDDGEELKARVWWRNELNVPTMLSYGFDREVWTGERWHTPRGWRWGEEEWGVHSSTDALVFAQTVFWMASSSDTLVVRFEQDGQTHSASFHIADITGIPIQANLVQCRFARPKLDSNGRVVDWGSLGQDLWWGVHLPDEEVPAEDSGDAGSVIGTYVVRESTIANMDGAIARMQVTCHLDVPDIRVYWEVDPIVDKTVTVALTDGQIETGEWDAVTTTWGEHQFRRNRLHGADAFELWTALYWAAQRGTLLTVESHARNNPNQRFTATFDLDGLFDTPVQPNLARCGR